MPHLNLIFVSALQHEVGHGLPAILENSMACNQSNSVRSMILFSAGNIMQVIDGEASETRSEMNRLFQSSHYINGIVLNEEEVDGPSLNCNSLGAQGLLANVIGLLPAEVAFFSLSESAVAQRVRQGRARNLLRQFAADYS